MRIKATLTLTLAISAHAHDADKIRVCVNSDNYHSYSISSAVFRAKNITSRMFATAGVGVEWRSAGNADCKGTQQTKTVILSFASNMPADYRPGAMAYAQLNEGLHIVVLIDRVENSCDGTGQMSALLAHVMTHEITHILQGIPRHSETGVMKAHWNPHDVWQMVYNPLPFEPEDIDLIHWGMRALATSLATSAVPQPAPLELR